MATLYTQQSKNIRKTWLLVGVFLSVILGLGYFLSVYYNNPSILVFAFIFSLVMNIASFWFSDKIPGLRIRQFLTSAQRVKR